MNKYNRLMNKKLKVSMKNNLMIHKIKIIKLNSLYELEHLS